MLRKFTHSKLKIYRTRIVPARDLYVSRRNAKQQPPYLLTIWTARNTVSVFRLRVGCPDCIFLFSGKIKLSIGNFGKLDCWLWAPKSVSGATLKWKNSQIHKLLFTRKRIRDNISTNGVNRASKTQSKLENFAHVLNIFLSHCFVLFFARLQLQDSLTTSDKVGELD